MPSKNNIENIISKPRKMILNGVILHAEVGREIFTVPSSAHSSKWGKSEE